MVIRCLLVCEGNSDAPLANHLQRLIEIHGQVEPNLDVTTSGRQVADKIRNGLATDRNYDLLFIHRDADRAGVDARIREISDAINDVGTPQPWVAIIPVRMTEAWLLLDEVAIRTVVGNPNGRTELDFAVAWEYRESSRS